MAGKKTVFVDSDILVIGGGFGGCGAAYESRYWGRDKKVVVVEKANIERSGAVAQGLYAITATWECVGEKMNRKTMCVTREMTSWDLFVRTLGMISAVM